MGKEQQKQCEIAECKWSGTSVAYRKHKSREHRDLIKNNQNEKKIKCICIKSFHHASSLCRHMLTCTTVCEIKKNNDIENPNPELMVMHNNQQKPSYVLNGNVLHMWYWNFLAEWQMQRSNGRLFDVILMDAPWKGSGVSKYPLLEDEQIATMPVLLIQKTGWIFKWVTNKKKPEGIKMIQEWGFEYTTTIVWEKTDSMEEEGSGMGYLPSMSMKTQFQVEKELLLHLKQLQKGISKPQSRKPERIYEMIEEMVPNGYYIEIFGRQHNVRPGWVTFGLEVKV